MRMILFGIAMTVVWGGVHYYVGQRLICGSRLQRPWNLIAWGLVAAHASLSPMVFAIRRGAPESLLLDCLQWVTYVGMGFFILLLTLVLARDLFFQIAGLLGWFNPADPFPDDPTRRTILTSGLNLGIFATSGVATGIGYVNARKRPDVDEVDLFVEGLPSDLDGFRIVQISDMHVGPTLRKPFVEMVVEVVNELDADIIAVTGDLVDGLPHELRDELVGLRSMKSRHGAYFVTGNHEYYWDAHGWQREVETLGLKSLANAHDAIRVGNATLLVGGVNDLHTGRFYPDEASDPHAAIENAPPHDFSVLLAHQPKSCYAASEAGWNLQLSGHTHGGQFYPWNFFVGLAHPFTAGLDKWGDTWVYVNRGTGYWGPPLRLGIPSEVTVLTLRRPGA